jgi:hypothetical protein
MITAWSNLMKKLIILAFILLISTAAYSQCPYPKHPRAWVQVKAPFGRCWSFGARQDATNYQHMFRDFSVTTITGTTGCLLFPNNKTAAKVFAVGLSLGINLATEFVQAERDFFDLYDFTYGLAGTLGGLILLEIVF